jgi:ABC-type lipoprotein release transport system permease subunit
MRAAFLWTRADVRRRWAALLALASLIAVLVGAVVALGAGARRADAAFDRWIEADDVPDIVINVGSEETGALVDARAADPRVDRLERADMVVIAPAPLEPGNDGFTIVGTDDSLAGFFGRPRLLAGRYPDRSSVDEIVVNERAAVTYGFHTGQRVALQGLECFVCEPTPAGEATVVGIVRLATDLTADPQLRGVAIGGPRFLDGRWKEFAHPGLAYGIHLHDLAALDSVVSELSVQVADGDVNDGRSISAPLARATRWQRNALVVAAVLVGLSGALVVAQALVRHLASRGGDADVLSALGLTTGERTMAAWLSVVPAVAAGTVGGLALAVAVSPALPLGVTRRVDPDVGVHVDGIASAVGAVAALALFLAVAWLAARRWARPAATGPARSRPPVVTRAISEVGLKPVAATGARYALSRGEGAARPFAVPSAAVLASAVMLVAGALVVRWSLDDLLEHGALYGQSFDLRAHLPDDPAAELAVFTGDPRVTALTVTRQGSINVAGRDGSPIQIATTSVESVRGGSPVAVLDGRLAAHEGEIALASATMRALGLHVGDRTTAQTACGTLDVEVVGRVIVPLTSSNFPDDGSIITPGTYDALCAEQNVSDVDVNQSALVRLRDHRDLEAARHDWESAGVLLTDPEVPNAVSLIRDLRPVPLVIGGVVTLLGAAAAAHALVLTVRQRRHDLAVLRSFGFRPRDAGGVIRWQAAVLAAVALVVGVPVGIAFGRVVWSAIAGSSNLVVRADVRLVGLGLLVLGIVALAMAAAVWPAHRATRLRPGEALRSE